MGDSGSDHWSCSVRISDDESGTRVFGREQCFVRDLLMEHFPAESGYEATGMRLGGPLEGVAWTVRRGSFRAELGVQRFARPRSGQAGRSHELRFVGNAGSGEASAVDSDAALRAVGWSTLGWGVGGLGLGALWLGTQVVLGGWGQLLVMIPAVVGWRATVRRLVRRADTAALPASRAAAALPSPQVEDGLARWRQLRPRLDARREQLEQVCGLPFRSVGHAEVIGGPTAAGSRPVDLSLPWS